MNAPLNAIPAPHNLALPPFLLSVDLVGARISVHGELDRRHAFRLDEAVDVLTHSTSPRWTIDASAISFCDATGLRALLRAQQLAAEAGRELVVARPSTCLRRLLGVAGIGAGPPAA